MVISRRNTTKDERIKLTIIIVFSHRSLGTLTGVHESCRDVGVALVRTFHKVYDSKILIVRLGGVFAANHSEVGRKQPEPHNSHRGTSAPPIEPTDDFRASRTPEQSTM